MRRRKIPAVPTLKPRPVPLADLVFHPEHDAAYQHFQGAQAHPFSARAGRLGRRNAWWLAEAALLSYWDPAEAFPRFRSAGLEADFLEAGALQAYVAWNETAVIVSFRGTEPDEWGDVLDDAVFVLKPGHRRGTFVHAGFKAAIDRVWPALDARLATLSSSRAVWFSGHSLGAALATLAADRWPDTAGVCSLGSPRVGDRAFAAAFNMRFLRRARRYVNDNDIVTHVPPPVILPLSYQHVGGLRHIAPDGTITARPPRLAHYVSDLFGDCRHIFEVMDGLARHQLQQAPDFILDHMPRTYAVDMWNDYITHGD